MTSKFRHRIHFDKKYYGYSSGCRNRNNLFGGLGSIRFSIRSRDSFSVWDITTPIASLHVNDSRNGKHVQKNIWIWPQRETLVFVVTCSQVIAVKCSTVRRGRGSTVSAKILLVSNMKSAYKIPRSYFNLTIDSPLKGCSARLVSLSSIIEGDGRMLNCLRGPNILVHYWVILPPSP